MKIGKRDDDTVIVRLFFFFRSRFFVDFVSRDWRYFVRDKVRVKVRRWRVCNFFLLRIEDCRGKNGKILFASSFSFCFIEYLKKGCLVCHG